ncbi:ThiF family adenylyltransferase [Parvibaculum sp.]|uniref:ThiF family adenylyltransferase n=1 Tax=Parvibaculum sp. TaxID=2024848 RepID=UPI002730B134|nr:ThiF family adenylyltransferase [Parvibaculum sp.]MDP1628481.1 ThiF family adenylyltransferase [Parvibaculum sp.]MDP2151813.1 ThiF family adenylyltransferase [Parvibaculum sp.]MDP3326936.1 ThiF family adenylyltransferase [Parvibaculum sp.]
MFQELVKHNKDIEQLLVKGYALALDSGHLVVRDIPYLDDKGELCWGAIVCTLKSTDKKRFVMKNHQIYFAGSHPYGLDGKPIPNLAGGSHSLSLISTDVVVQRSMSNKPTGGYPDHVAKIDRYVAILSGPAMERYGVTPLTFRQVKSEGEESVFKFADTLTSSAEIGDLAQFFKNEVVAIIGLGGTGSYVLDYMAKTPVARILGFDRDLYHVHNAFRSPGRLADDGELDHSKAEVYQGRYENFRHGITLLSKFIDESCIEELKDVTFAFVCVDKGSSRRGIFDLLMKLQIPFIDVGMGLNRKQYAINGTLRATYYEPANAQTMRDRNLAELSDHPDDEYRVTVQTAELNALNACLAVIRYKQLKGFYLDENGFDHFLFKVNDLKIHGEPR